MGIDVPNQLSYAPQTVSDRRWRLARRMGYSIIAATALLFAILCFRQVPNRLRAIRAQRAAMNFCMTPNQVVYADRLFKQAVRYDPPAWDNLKPFAFAAGFRSVLFLHRLISPDGHERIVVVTCGDRDQDGHIACEFDVIQPGTLSVPPTWLFGGELFPFPPSQSDDFTIYGGQADPSDPSHFTIRYQRGQRCGTIDGWLENDERVKLEPRI